MVGFANAPDSAPLVIRFGAIGDMILITPLLRALAERHGRPCDVIGHSRWLPVLFRHLPFVGEVRTIDSLNAPYLFEPSKQRVTRWLRERAPGPIYVLQADSATVAMVRRARITPLASEVQVPRAMGEHPVDWHQRLCGFSQTWRRDPELLVSEAEMADCQNWIAQRGLTDAPLVLIQAGNRKTSSWRTSSTDRKIWALESWIAVARGVLARLPHVRVLLIGAPKEQLLAREIEQGVGDPRVIAVADQLPLRRLFALQRYAHSMISVDTGPAHAAAALGCPAVVLFGHTDPRATGPITGLGPCRTVHPPAAPSLTSHVPWPKDSCLSGITPDNVLRSWQSLSQHVGQPLLTA
jgi:ADP-heptose:LPS heptosyltransferase